VLRGGADPHVDHDLLQSRNRERVAPPQRLREPRLDFFAILIRQSGHNLASPPCITAESPIRAGASRTSGSGAPRVPGVGGTDETQLRLTLATVPDLAAVRLELEPDPHPALAGVTVKEHIRDVNRHLQRQPPPLRALGMAALHVLVHAIDPFDHDLLAAVQYLEHLAR